MTMPHPTEPATLRDVRSLGERLRIAVIYGGDKQCAGTVLYRTRNFRPWKSYEGVARDIQAALLRLGFRHVVLLPESMALPAQLAYHGIHLAWLNSGGVQGYCAASHAPAMLEMLGLPYVGHGPVETVLLDTKDALKRQLQSLGIPTPPFVVRHPEHRGDPSEGPDFTPAFEGYTGPFVVKPVSGRASLNVHVVESRAELGEAVAAVCAATRHSVIVERYVPGREFTVAVAGGLVHRDGRYAREAEPFAFSAIERLLDPDERIFSSMDDRPITPERLRLVQEEEPVLAEALCALARQVYRALNLHALVRADIRAAADGTLQVLEVNPKPDLKHPEDGVTSFVAAGLAREGMSYDDLILSLLADRFDHLLTYQRDTFPHIEALIDGAGDVEDRPRLLSTA